MAAFGDENICRLHVAVHDAFTVRGIKRVGHFDRNVQKTIHRHRLAGYQVLERAAIEILHGDKGVAVLLRDLVNCADVGVIQRGCGSCFATEPFKRLRVAGDVFRKEFQRNEAAELVVLGFVDDAHASTTEFLDHSIVRNGEANRRLRFCHGWRTS